MPPRKFYTATSGRQTRNLDSFFAVQKSTPKFQSTSPNIPSQTTAQSQQALDYPTPAIPTILLDSDSDDSLLEPHDILGPAAPATPALRPGLRPRTLAASAAESTPLSARKSAATPYRNNLNSLVRAQKSKKYDMQFLDEQLLRMSDSDSGEENANAKPISDSAVQDTIPNLSGVDAERIRAQLGANTDSVRSFTRIYLFSSTKWPATAPTAAGFVVNTDAVFKTDDPVEKVFSANACTYRKFMQHALSSQWIKAQASVGWRLTQSVGDALLQEMCFEADSDLARCAWLTLRSFVDLRISTWKLRFEKFVFLLEKLQGRLWDKADESPENDEPSMCESHSSSTSSSLSVCVDVVIPRRLHTARSSSERVSYLMDIAALSLDLASIEDSCRVLTLHASSLLDHGNRTHRMHMQRSFACLLNRVSPASNWSLTCSGLVAELGRRFLHLQAQTQLGIVERLPTVNRRCMQVRRGLSFIFLRIHASCGLHADESIESLARTATLPSQIILRVVSELMEGSDQLFRVNASVDFAKLEAIIGLLSNILDSVQAMRDVRDVSRAIYQRLCVINQRISDGVADSIDKTLAKDAVQTLVVRLLMTAVSDSTEQRLSPVYNTSITLDSWINSS